MTCPACGDTGSAPCGTRKRGGSCALGSNEEHRHPCTSCASEGSRIMKALRAARREIDEAAEASVLLEGRGAGPWAEIGDELTRLHTLVCGVILKAQGRGGVRE